MEILALVIAVVALVIAVLAYSRTGGVEDLRSQLKTLGPTTETLRTKAAGATEVLRTKAGHATEGARAKTADALERLEKAVRGSGESPAPTVPEEQKPVAEEQKPVPGDKKKEQ
ncbi:MAG: hypothetical protein V3U33_05785 [candidate division NC10 bacterium]